MTAHILRLPIGNQTLGAIHAKPSKPKEAPESEKPKKNPSEQTSAAPLPPLAIMAHNLPFGTMRDHEDLFGRIENLLTDMGLHTLRFDFRGCGGSAPPPGDFPTLGSASLDLGAALEWGKKQGHTQFILIAEGLSASLALPRMTDDLTIAAILLWPVFDPKQMAVERFGADPEMAAPASDAAIEIRDKKISARLIYEMVRTDLSSVMKKISMPLLIQQGDSDAESPTGQLDIARKMLRTKRLDITTYAGAGRGLTDQRHRKYMLYHIQQFVEKYAGGIALSTEPP